MRVKIAKFSWRCTAATTTNLLGGFGANHTSVIFLLICSNIFPIINQVFYYFIDKPLLGLLNWNYNIKDALMTSLAYVDVLMIGFDLCGCVHKKCVKWGTITTSLLPLVFGTYSYILYFVIFSVFLKKFIS